jgi:uncharacterized protein involved in outer membrane biogenesis
MSGTWWQRIPQPLRWLGAVVILLLLLVIGAGVTDWNFARGFVSRTASRQLHRTVVIDGELRVHLLSSAPSVSVGDLRIANPDWAGGGSMLQLHRLLIELQLSQLFRGRVVLRTLELDQPQLLLRRDSMQHANWDFGKPASAARAHPTRLPAILHFSLRGGELDVADAVRKLSFHGSVAADETGAGSGTEPFRLEGHGTLNKEPFDLTFAGGALLNVNPNRPYAFTLKVAAGATRLSLDGSITKPFDLGKFDVSAEVRGQNLANLYYLTGLALPLTAAYHISAHVQRDDMHFALGDIAGKLGNSDISGHATLDVAADGRPDLKVTLVSKSLDLADLGIAFGAGAAQQTQAGGAPQQPAPAQQPISPLLLPDFQFQFDRLALMDASFDLHADSVQALKLPIKALSFSLKLDHGVLDIVPVDFELPLGKLTGEVHLDTRAAPPQATVDMRLSDVNLDQFKGATMAQAPLSGILDMHVHLAGHGNSVHAIAADADGKLAAAIPHGEIRQALAELTGINVLSGVGLLLTGNQNDVAIRCGVAEFQVTDGDARAGRLVVDTQPVLITGNGHVTMSDEKLDLNIAGKPKKITITRIRAPINLRGTLRNPSVSLSVPSLVEQGSIAVAAAVLLTPVGALLAFIDPGLAKNQDCAALLDGSVDGPAGGAAP